MEAKSILGNITKMIEETGLLEIEAEKISRDTPVILPPIELESAYTLDSIYLSGSVWCVKCSSDEHTTHKTLWSLSTDALSGMEVWLEKNMPALMDKNGPARKDVFVIRFYRRAWTDIAVQADDAEQAFEKAEERYNNGDYDDDDESFENTDSSNVTDEYVQDGIPFPDIR